MGIALVLERVSALGASVGRVRAVGGVIGATLFQFFPHIGKDFRGQFKEQVWFFVYPFGVVFPFKFLQLCVKVQDGFVEVNFVRASFEFRGAVNACGFVFFKTHGYIVFATTIV